MQNALNFGVIYENWPLLLHGAWLTMQMTIISVVLGTVIAAVGAYQVVYGSVWIRGLWNVYVEIVRNTPLLAQLFLIFFGLPALGVKMSADVGAIVALTFNFAAYAVEILRAGIESIAKGQIEAGTALALTRAQIYRLIILKPALATIYPALTSQCVLVLLGSAIISTISADDLSSVAASLQSSSFRSFEVYIAVTILYFLSAMLLQAALDLLGRRAFPFIRAGAR